MIKTFDEYLAEAYTRKPSQKEINNVERALVQLKNEKLYGHVINTTVNVDDRTGDVFFSTTTGYTFVYHPKTNYVQELYSKKVA